MTTDPPQHLLGGLNVAILVASGTRHDQLDTSRAALEELGVNVLVVGPDRRPAAGVMADGRRAAIPVSQGVALVDPASCDGVLVLADAEGARQLASSPVAHSFLAAVDAEGKPIGAVGEGVLPLLRAGLAQSRTVSATPALAGQAETAGGTGAGEALSVDGNLVTLAHTDGLDGFNAALKQLLAQRRLATITIGNDTPSAVGEDG